MTLAGLCCPPSRTNAACAAPVYIRRGSRGACGSLGYLPSLLVRSCHLIGVVHVRRAPLRWCKEGSEEVERRLYRRTPARLPVAGTSVAPFPLAVPPVSHTAHIYHRPLCISLATADAMGARQSRPDRSSTAGGQRWLSLGRPLPLVEASQAHQEPCQLWPLAPGFPGKPAVARAAPPAACTRIRCFAALRSHNARPTPPTPPCAHPQAPQQRRCLRRCRNPRSAACARPAPPAAPLSTAASQSSTPAKASCRRRPPRAAWSTCGASSTS